MMVLSAILLFSRKTELQPFSATINLYIAPQETKPMAIIFCPNTVIQHTCIHNPADMQN